MLSNRNQKDSQTDRHDTIPCIGTTQFRQIAEKENAIVVA